jgi:BlaI family transcriptional regulator, penicillinase repressor
VAGRKTLTITDRQYAILRILWAEGPLTVRELTAHLPGGEAQPYTTVLGMVQNMEKAGLVTHSKEGAAHRYRAAVGEQETTRKLVKDFVNRFFRGSAEALVAGLVDAEALSPEDLRELEAKLAEAQPESEPSSGKRQTTKRRAAQRRRRRRSQS